MYFHVILQAVIRGKFPKVHDIIEELAAHSCSYLIDLTTEDEGYNLLHFAVCNKHSEIVQYLIESGAGKEAMCYTIVTLYSSQ